MSGLLAQKARLRLWTDRALSNVMLSNIAQHLVQRTQEVPEVLRCLQPTPSMTSSVSAPSRRKHFTKHGTPADLLGFRRSRRYWKLHPRGKLSRGIRLPPGTTTKSQPGPKFLIQTFKQPIDPSLRKPRNPTASSRHSELSLLATRAPLTTHACGPATPTRPSAADNLALGNEEGAGNAG